MVSISPSQEKTVILTGSKKEFSISSFFFFKSYFIFLHLSDLLIEILSKVSTAPDVNSLNGAIESSKVKFCSKNSFCNLGIC